MMKTNLNILISNILFVIMAFGCQEKLEEDLILSQADDIISFYTNQINFQCSSVGDDISYPEPWTSETADTFTINDTTLDNVSTCGLIQTFFNQPWNILGPWCSTCSDLSINGMQYFNDKVNQDVVVSKLFLREDGLTKLLGKYVEVIQDLGAFEEIPGALYSFEILLAGESMSKILTDTLSEDLTFLALKMIDVKKGFVEFSNENSLAITRHILANIMLENQFQPFISACTTDGSLETSISGYNVCYESDKVENYAKMYLKN